MLSRTKKLGDLGEKIAQKYLKKQDYKILEVNFRYKKYGEIDIIAKKDENISFIEVKTRLCPLGYGGQARVYSPEDNITYFKQKQLIKLAKLYLAKNRILLDNPWQIDVIAIEADQNSKNFNIRHIKQAIQDIY